MRLDHDLVNASSSGDGSNLIKKTGNNVKSYKNVLNQQFHFRECTLGKLSKESHAIYMHVCVHCTFIQSSENLQQPKCPTKRDA